MLRSITMRLLRNRRGPTNVFVLGTGRCGTTTFIRACEHLNNFTAGHETRAGSTGLDRFHYPSHHIEADNRLSWLLGQLESHFGYEQLYVHLKRDPEKVPQSFAARCERPYQANMIRAFAHGILMRSKRWPTDTRLKVCRFYVETVTTNIEVFLRDKSNPMSVWLEEASSWWPQFWDRIAGSGDASAAMQEFKVRHNAS